MALIDNRGQVIEDLWSYPDPGTIGTVRANCVTLLDTLSLRDCEFPLERPIGVYASAGTTADRIAPVLGELDLVVVEFPKFRDGRGFTLARTLRGKHGFKGDIRAIGHVLPDQFPALVQCGFSSIVLPADHPPEQWIQSGAAAVRHAGGPLLQRLLSARSAPAAHREKT